MRTEAQRLLAEEVYLPLITLHRLGYFFFFIAVTKHHVKATQERKHFIQRLKVPERFESMTIAEGSSKREFTSYPQARGKERDRETDRSRQGKLQEIFETSKPTSIITPPPTRPHLLLILPKAVLPTGNQAFKMYEPTEAMVIVIQTTTPLNVRGVKSQRCHIQRDQLGDVTSEEINQSGPHSLSVM